MLNLHVLYLLSSISLYAAQDVLENGGFEDPIGNSWSCNNCQGQLNGDKIEGSTSYLATGRTQFWQGPVQALQLGTQVIAGKRYTFSGFMKLLPKQGAVPQRFKVTLRSTTQGGTTTYAQVALKENVSPEDNWVEMKGSFTVEDSTPLSGLAIYAEGPQGGYDFLSDAFTVRGDNNDQTDEIFENPGFEENIGSDNWICNQCTGELSTDVYSGTRSLLVKDRSATWQGPLQQLPLGSRVFVGRYYYFSGFIKLLPKANGVAQDFRITLKYTKDDNTLEYVPIANRNGVSSGSGWVNIASEFVVKDFGRPLSNLILYLEGPEPGYEFLCDEFSLTQITLDPDWRNQARARIENMRKGDLTVVVQSGNNQNDVVVKVNQQKHEFEFGSAVDSDTLQNNTKYREWYLDNFEWAVLENDLKWRQTEWTQGVLKWDKARAAINDLKNQDKSIRGHTMFWAAKERNPDWVQSITNPTQLWQTCQKRVSDVIGEFRGELEHWDVNNEMLKNSFYKDVFGSSTIRYEMFNWIHNLDSYPKLFLNDYEVVRGGQRTNEYVEQAKEFMAANVPLYGLGAQGHINEAVPGPILLHRLDRLASTELPIWITELDYSDPNNNTRAAVLEDTLIAFFSHKSVEGILFWGFWDGRHWRKADAALVNGADMTPNAAGEMWMRLFHTDWRSNEEIQLGNIAAGTGSEGKKRVFYGDYRIEVTVGSNTIHQQNISMKAKDGAKTVVINI